MFEGRSSTFFVDYSQLVGKPSPAACDVITGTV
jgi:hypothetical protein